MLPNMTRDEELICEHIRQMGATPVEVFCAAQVARNATILSIIAVRAVFAMDLKQAMDVVAEALKVQHAPTAREEELLPLLQQFFEQRMGER